jgi:hypothetical protein
MGVRGVKYCKPPRKHGKTDGKSRAGVCRLDVSRRQTAVKKGLAQPTEYTDTVDEAIIKAGLRQKPRMAQNDTNT